MSDLIDGVLESSLIRGQVKYRVITPQKYSGSNARFSALYLLHGLFGSFENWTDLTDLQTFAVDHQLIIVMPDGADSWYTDAGSGREYESYLISELIPEIDCRFRTIADRSGRAVAGNSMGGYGAFKFALKYSDRFALAASFSGAFDASRQFGPSPGVNWNELGPSITKVFGEKESPLRRANDLEYLAESAAAKSIADFPYFYFDCGLCDEYISANRKLCEIFSNVGILHKYKEFEGGHDWDYWNSRVGHLLRLASQKLILSREG